jgi:hypothetical protein
MTLKHQQGWKECQKKEAGSDVAQLNDALHKLGLAYNIIKGLKNKKQKEYERN